MVENVQCPVCTLFLHAGMNLSDHLETHPKEQVIKALVQMTIVGGGSAAGGAAGDAKSEPAKVDKETDLNSNAASNSSSSSSSVTAASDNSLNFAAAFNSMPTTSVKKTPSDMASGTLDSGSGTESRNSVGNLQAGTALQVYQRSCGAGAVAASSNSGALNDVFDPNHYQQQPQQQHVRRSQLSQPQATAMQHVLTTAVSSPQQHSVLPPPPPAPPLASQQLGLLAGTMQQQNALIATSLTRQHELHAANQHQPQHHQQQNLKIPYSTTLPPPPPPLQLFFQQPTQAQHQKPPPAYGAAISQIRSQHSLNKKPIAMSIMQQQPPQNNLRGLTTSQLYSQTHIQNMPLHANTDAATIKHVFQQARQQCELSPPSTSLAAHQQKYVQESVQVQHGSYENKTSTSHMPGNKLAMSSHHDNSAIPLVLPVHSKKASAGNQPCPSSMLTSMSSPCSTSTNRQTNSPLQALLVAASQSPSVLRYAESPVAHYLERENGDFIVQETPKHIVECVEKENGEFSVIERIYQSPPSVLHIHDNDENIEDKDQLVSIDTITTAEPNKSKSTYEGTKKEDDDFMSIESESDDQEFSATTSHASFPMKRTKLNNNEGRLGIDNAKSANTTASENTASSSETVPTLTSDSNSNTISNSTESSKSFYNSHQRKKSSKNTITVLSDVQLNLNEYLDLVGNIIASSKISPQCTTLSGTMPIPLLKVEKIEPPDEYETQRQHDEDEQKDDETQSQADEQLIIDNASAEPTVIEPPTIANKNETEELVEITCNSNKTSVNENDENLTNGDYREQNSSRTVQNEQNAGTSVSMTSTSSNSCPSHATSVIRMATTSQQQQHSHSQQNFCKSQQHQTLNKEEEHLSPNSYPSGEETIRTAMFNDLSDSGENREDDNVAKDLTTQDKRPLDEHNINIAGCSSVKNVTTAPTASSHRKGPKKLIIKPKATKTESIANNDNVKNSKNLQSNAQNSKNNVMTEIRTNPEQPTTSAMAQRELRQKEQRQKQQQLQQQKELSEDNSNRPHEQRNDKIEQKDYDALPQSIVIKSEPNSTAYDGCSSISILEKHLKSSNNSVSDQEIELKQESASQLVKDENIAPVKLKKENSAIENITESARVLLDFANAEKGPINNDTAYANFLSSSSIFSSTAAASSAGVTTSLSGSVVNNKPTLLTSLRCEEEFVANDVVQEIVISSTYSSQSASDVALNATSSATRTSSTNESANVQQQEQKQNQQQHTFDGYSFNFLYSVGGNNAVCSQSETKTPFWPIYQQALDATTAATVASGSSSAHLEDSTSTHESQQRVNHFSSNTAQWYHHAISTANSDFDAALVVDCNAAVDGDVGKYLDLDTCKRESIVGVQVAPSSTSSSFTAATESSLAGGCTTDALNIRTDEKMPAKGEISGQESNCDIDNSWSQPMYGEISTRFFKTSFPAISHQENGWNNDEYFTVQDLSASTTAASSSTNKPAKSFDFRLPLEASTSASMLGNSSNNNIQMFPQHSGDVMPSTSASKKKRKRDMQNDKVTITRVQPTATVTSQQLFNQQSQHQRPLIEYAQFQQLNASTSTLALLPSPSTAVATSSSGTTSQQKPRKKIYQCTHCTAEFPRLKDRNSHMIVQHNYVRQNRRLICSQVPSTSTAVSGDVEVVEICSPNDGNEEYVEDSKQAIVKIEMDNCEQKLSITDDDGNAETKTEFIDEKISLSVVPRSDANSSDTGRDVDTKPVFPPLAVSTPATKLATLYRMLVSFNISTLKQSQNLTEFEEKLIETSIFFCYVCRRNFTSVKLYDAHLTEHPAECFTCGKKFQRWKNFSLHLKRHLGWKEFGCNICDKKFVVRSALVEHMRMHTGHTPLKCKVCGKYFKRYSNLTQHRKRHGKQIVRKKEYVCYCGEVLPSKARFLWHKETHDAKPKCCPYCCDRFVHANSLRRHIRLAHSDKFDYTEPMECPMCKQIFAKTSIKAHMATHSMDTQHDCPICNKSFSTKWNLKIHSWVHANRTAKPFKCEHCPKAFVREVDFKNHMNAHKQIKPYTCEYCGCKFIRKYNYMRHRREHHGNKKFTCDLCKKSFHRHYYLIEHRRIHTGERPFQCTICGKSSTTKTNHNKHLKIHHSRDPFTVEA